MSTPKMEPDVAKAEFDRWVEAAGLDVDTKGMDEEDRKSLDLQRRRITLAIISGQITIDEDGLLSFKPSTGDTSLITFFEPTGASMMASDQRKKNHDVAKSIAIMADATRQNSERFAKMVARDLKICLAINNLFWG